MDFVIIESFVGETSVIELPNGGILVKKYNPDLDYKREKCHSVTISYSKTFGLYKILTVSYKLLDTRSRYDVINFYDNNLLKKVQPKEILKNKKKYFWSKPKDKLRVGLLETTELICRQYMTNNITIKKKI